MSLVLDSSMALTWCLRGQSNALSVAVFQQVQSRGAIVPWVWHLEMSNILGLKARDGNLTRTELEQSLRLLELLPIESDPISQTFTCRDLLELMRRIRLTGYDATYVDLALRSGLPLATFDREMREAARQIGVPLVTV